jgi:hypothetical protein
MNGGMADTSSPGYINPAGGSGAAQVGPDMQGSDFDGSVTSGSSDVHRATPGDPTATSDTPSDVSAALAKSAVTPNSVPPTESERAATGAGTPDSPTENDSAISQAQALGSTEPGNPTGNDVDTHKGAVTNMGQVGALTDLMMGYEATALDLCFARS